MPRTLLSLAGGTVTLPDLVLNDRRDGGHLVVTPASGWAMLTVLPQLDNACINYWEAGNWSLHDAAEPAGVKSAREYRRVHTHVFGRSRTAPSDAWQWGEAPQFPRFAHRLEWAAQFTALTADECAAIVQRIAERLERYR